MFENRKIIQVCRSDWFSNWLNDNQSLFKLSSIFTIRYWWKVVNISNIYILTQALSIPQTNSSMYLIAETSASVGQSQQIKWWNRLQQHRLKRVPEDDVPERYKHIFGLSFQPLLLLPVFGENFGKLKMQQNLDFSGIFFHQSS